MIEYYLRSCIECGGKTIKEDVCSKCRRKAKHPGVKNYITRSEVNANAITEQSMTLEQAEWLYADAMERLRVNQTDQEAWHDKRRAVARLSREEIDTNTLI